MGIYGKTKGTEIEKQIAQLAAGEAMGGAMYYALAHIAQGWGLDDVAAQFVELGNQETNHGGFYARRRSGSSSPDSPRQSSRARRTSACLRRNSRTWESPKRRRR